MIHHIQAVMKKEETKTMCYIYLFKIRNIFSTPSENRNHHKLDDPVLWPVLPAKQMILKGNFECGMKRSKPNFFCSNESTMHTGTFH